MELIKLEPFVINKDVFLKGKCRSNVRFVRVINEKNDTKLIPTINNRFIIDLSRFSLKNKKKCYLELYDIRKIKLGAVEVPLLELPNRIVNVSPFTIGKDKRLNIECSGNIFRVQVISGEQAGARAGLTNNKINYYIGDLIRSKNSKTKVVAVDELGNILDEVEVEVKSLFLCREENINSVKLELLNLYNSLNNFEGIDYNSLKWSGLVIALAEAKCIYESLDVTEEEIKNSIDRLKKYIL